MWREIDFPLVDEDAGALHPFMEALRGLYANGAVVHKTFAMPARVDFDEFLHLGRLHDIFFFERFWLASSVRAALPFDLHEVEFLSPTVFSWTQRVELPGSLASALVRGGAYRNWDSTAREAMRLGLEAAEVLLAGDFEEPRVFVSQTAWSRFFHDVAWDYTWLVIEPRRRRIDVLLATDTD